MDANNILAMEDELAVQGLFIDEIHRLRILDPSLADQTHKLKTECDQFLQSKQWNSIYSQINPFILKLFNSFICFCLSNEKFR